MGRSRLGELSTFQLLLFVTMGDLVQQSITQQDYSVTSGILAVGVFALLTTAVSVVIARWPPHPPVIHGVPVVIVRRGEPLVDVMHRERISVDDLMAPARENGLRRITDVDLAVFEADRKIPFFTASDDETSACASGGPSAEPGGSAPPRQPAGSHPSAGPREVAMSVRIWT